MHRKTIFGWMTAPADGQLSPHNDLPIITGTTDVLGLTFWLMLRIGVIFQIPLVMYLLAKLRLVTHARFKKIRKFVPPSAAIFGAILSPGFDIVTATMIFLPIWMLFEFGLTLAWLTQPGSGHVLFRRLKMGAIGLLKRIVLVPVLWPIILIAYVVLTASIFVASVFYVLLYALPITAWDARWRAERHRYGRAWVKRFVLRESQGGVFLNCLESTKPGD
jgi:hypothetical protein